MVYCEIYCCGCEKEVNARLTAGREVWPKNWNAQLQPVWICDECGCYVGCHYKTKDWTRPLGTLADEKLREARKKIHDLIDPHWKYSKNQKSIRQTIYKKISDELGYEYHTGEIRTINDARTIYRVARGVLIKMGLHKREPA